MRLIDGTVLVEALAETKRIYLAKDFDNVALGIETAITIAENAPTIDAVSVVRCKECKHTNSEPPIADGRSWCVLHGCFMYYCSDGEREGE